MEGAAAKNERDPQDVHFVQSGLDETGLSLNNIGNFGMYNTGSLDNWTLTMGKSRGRKERLIVIKNRQKTILLKGCG